MHIEYGTIIPAPPKICLDTSITMSTVRSNWDISGGHQGMCPGSRQSVYACWGDLTEACPEQDILS